MNDEISRRFVDIEDERLHVVEVVHQKIRDVALGVTFVEFTPEEAELAGAFEEDAIDVDDAIAASLDGPQSGSERLDRS